MTNDKPKPMTKEDIEKRKADIEEQALAVKAGGTFIAELAEQCDADPEEVKRTIFRSCMFPDAKVEHFAVLLMNAAAHNLNPLNKEICAIPKKDKGEIVGVNIIWTKDTWNRKNNEDPNFDGGDWTYHYVIDGKQVAYPFPVAGQSLAVVEYRRYHKKRKHPSVGHCMVSEYDRGNNAWKYLHVMARHKAYKMASEEGCGLTGILDEYDAVAMVDRPGELPPMLQGGVIDQDPGENATPQPEKPEPSGRSKAPPPPAKDPEPKEDVASGAQHRYIIGLFYQRTGLPKPKDPKEHDELDLFLEERGTPYGAITPGQAHDLIEAWNGKESEPDLTELDAFMEKYHPPQDASEPKDPGEGTGDAENGPQEPSAGQSGLFSDLSEWPFTGEGWPKDKQAAEDKRLAVMDFMRQVAEHKGITWTRVAYEAAELYGKELKKLKLSEWRDLHNTLVE
jgi:hypothetical protein